MPVISFAEIDDLKGVRKGTRPVSLEVKIMRDLECGEGFLFTNEDTVMETDADATRLANRLSSYGSKNREEFILRTKRVRMDDGSVALAVKKLAPDS